MSAVSVIVKAILADRFTGLPLRRASASMTTAWAVGPIVAPMIGGYIQQYIRWQANFYALFIYGLVCLIATAAYLPETRQGHVKKSLSEVLDDFKLILSSTVFVSTVTCLGLGYGLLMVFNAFAPFLIQSTLHYSAVAYGHIALVMGVTYFLGNFFNQSFTSKISMHYAIFISFTLQVAGITALTLVAVTLPPGLYTFILPTLFIYIGAAALYPNFMVVTLSQLPQQPGACSAIVGCVLMLITSLITAAVSRISVSTTAPIAYIFIGLILLTVALYLAFIRSTLKDPQ